MTRADDWTNCPHFSSCEFSTGVLTWNCLFLELHIFGIWEISDGICIDLRSYSSFFRQDELLRIFKHTSQTGPWFYRQLSYIRGINEDGRLIVAYILTSHQPTHSSEIKGVCENYFNFNQAKLTVIKWMLVFTCVWPNNFSKPPIIFTKGGFWKKWVWADV